MSQIEKRLIGAAGLVLPTLCLMAAGSAHAQAAAPALLGHQAALELDSAGASWLGTSTALVRTAMLPITKEIFFLN